MDNLKKIWGIRYSFFNATYVQDYICPWCITIHTLKQHLHVLYSPVERCMSGANLVTPGFPLHMIM